MTRSPRRSFHPPGLIAGRSATGGARPRVTVVAASIVAVASLVLAACGGGASGSSTSSSNAAATAATVYRWGVVGTKGAIRQLELDTPQAIAGIKGSVVQLATSNSDGYALTSTGSVYAWGVDSYGELGDGTLAPYRTEATEVDFPAGVTITSLPNPMPFDAGLAIDSTGHVWGWGLNGVGDLCLSGLVESRPEKLPFSDVTLATGARTHALFDSHGTVYACGSGDAGELGNALDRLHRHADTGRRAAERREGQRPHVVVGGIRSAARRWQVLQLGIQRGGPIGQRLHRRQCLPGRRRTSGCRHAGLPRRERGEERPDDCHPPGRGGLGVGQQRSWSARHWQPDRFRCAGPGPRSPKRHLREGQLGRLRQLRHRLQRTTLGLGRQPERTARHRFGTAPGDPSGGGGHPSHTSLVDGPECGRIGRGDLIRGRSRLPVLPVVRIDHLCGHGTGTGRHLHLVGPRPTHLSTPLEPIRVAAARRL